MKSNFNLPFTNSHINNITEGKCKCIGNNDYENCVLDNIFSECYYQGATLDPKDDKAIKLANLFANNKCLFSKAKCGDASDQAILNVLANANGINGNKLTPEENCKLFDIYKDPNFTKFNEANNTLINIYATKSKAELLNFSSEISDLMKNAKDCNDVKAIEDKLKSFWGDDKFQQMKLMSVQLYNSQNALSTTFGNPNNTLGMALGIQNNPPFVPSSDPQCGICYSKYINCLDKARQAYFNDLKTTIPFYTGTVTAVCLATGVGIAVVPEAYAAACLAGAYEAWKNSALAVEACDLDYKSCKLSYNCP